MTSQYSIKPAVTTASSDPSHVGHTRYIAYDMQARRPIDCGADATLEQCKAFMAEHYPEWECVPDPRPMSAQDILEMHGL